MVAVNDASPDTFDFIVVGGGTAGLVLAARLSEDARVNVCVIEAGASRTDDPVVATPSGVGLMLGKPEYDWNHFSTPQRGTGDKVYNLPRGRMLGGSSALNFMAYGRPCKADIDDWASVLGLSGWSWEELLPYFKISEKLDTTNRDAQTCPLDPSVHGTEGFIYTSLAPWNVPFESKLLPALDRVSGLPRPKDPYNGSHVGFSRALFTIDRTARPFRSYLAGTILELASVRPNLRLVTNTTVLKVVIENGADGSLQATGVQIRQEDQGIHMLHARKEVVLSAGSYSSPAILERSGVGDPAILERAHVRCLVNNPEVGSNLQEHVMSAVVYELADGTMSLDSLSREPTLLQHHQKLYAEHHSGALSGCVNLIGYLPLTSLVSQQAHEELQSKVLVSGSPTEPTPPTSHKQREAIARRMRGEQAADIQIIGTPATFDARAGYGNLSKLMAGPRPGFNASYSLVVSPMYPASRGTVHITSSSPDDMPAIDPGFFNDRVDVEIMAAGLRFADAAFQSEPLTGCLGRRVEPPPEIDLQDDRQAQAYARENIVTYHHALGTCAMGTVVDERLRLIGVNRLRVVDASVIPMQVSAATMATVYAVAEKAAAMIREDHGNSL